MSDNEWVDLTVARGCVYRSKQGDSKAVKPGDKISAPTARIENGVFPVRWWEATGKAFRDAKAAKAAAAEATPAPADG